MIDASIHVLLVDDDVAYTKIVHQSLTSFAAKQFAVSVTHTGPDAVAAMKADPSIDIVLLDYFLGGTNGLEVAKEMRALGFETPIVFVTWNKDFELAVEGIQLGVEDYLVKDEIATSILPSTIISSLQRSALKKQISDERKQSALIHQRAEAIKELVITVCHEFNNPLAAIKISTEIISRGSATPHDRVLMEHLNRQTRSIEKEIMKLKDITITP
ncbi:MAG TPA: response regulator [Bacteroidota bacterium]|nr:response regulator [Bacteroidota bacterium]